MKDLNILETIQENSEKIIESGPARLTLAFNLLRYFLTQDFSVENFDRKLIAVISQMDQKTINYFDRYQEL